jgi:CDP-diacylglycerol--serine O-phosphatidyltransferase
MIKHIPNLLTLINMSLGLTAVLVLIQTAHPHKAAIAAALIVLGGLVDFFDGHLARRLKAESRIGKQLDSFADIITFGIAPICLINYVSTCGAAFFVIGASLIFMMAGAYRLARYNLNDIGSHFMGLPITAAGIALAAYSAIYPLWAAGANYVICTAVTAGFIVLLSAMMISKRKVRRISAR